MKGAENPGADLDKVIHATTKKTVHDTSVAKTPEEVVKNVLRK